MTKVLIVDDDPGLRRMLAAILANGGCETREAADGVLALAVLDQHPVDLVITDIFMPEMDGMALLRKVQEQHPTVKLIAISGGSEYLKSYSAEYLDLMKHLGASHILAKPLDAATLMKAVREACPER